MIPGDIVRVSLPGHVLHNKQARIVSVDPAFDLAHPDSAERMLAEVIFVSHPSLPQPIGIGRENLWIEASQAVAKRRPAARPLPLFSADAQVAR